MEDKKLKLAEVKVIFETLKAIAAKNNLTFARQWRFREVSDVFKVTYDQLHEDSMALNKSDEKDLEILNGKYRELLNVEVEIKNIVSLPKSWFMEKDADGKQIMINGEEMDILMEYDIIEIEKPKVEEVKPE